MAELLREKSCADFAALLGSEAPAPGGGGAAALGGALAAALGGMAARLSRKGREEQLQGFIDRADALRGELLALIDGDAEGFLPLAAAYAIPKDDPARPARLREATVLACAAPMAMMEAVSGCLELLEELKPLCKRLLLSDLGCAAALCGAALEAASMNVYINTRSLRGTREGETLEQRADALRLTGRERADALRDEVLRQLREA